MRYPCLHIFGYKGIMSFSKSISAAIYFSDSKRPFGVDGSFDNEKIKTHSNNGCLIRDDNALPLSQYLNPTFERYIWVVPLFNNSTKMNPVLFEMRMSVVEWRHNGRHGVSNQWRLNCLLNHLFRRISKKTSKIREESTRDRWFLLTNSQ